MKAINILVAVAALGVASVASADDLHLMSTGQNLSVGSTDSNYMVGGNSSVVVSNLPSSWVNNGNSSVLPDAKWISVDANGGNVPNAGVTVFTYTFDLSGYNSATAEINGQWSSDNGGVMKLNGTTISSIPALLGGSQNSYTYLTSFGATSGFVSGVNTLEFDVTNGLDQYADPGPTGMYAELHGSAQAVPEPISMLGLAGGAVAMLRRRRQNAAQ